MQRSGRNVLRNVLGNLVRGWSYIMQKMHCAMNIAEQRPEPVRNFLCHLLRYLKCLPDDGLGKGPGEQARREVPQGLP